MFRMTVVVLCLIYVPFTQQKGYVVFVHSSIVNLIIECHNFSFAIKLVNSAKF